MGKRFRNSRERSVSFSLESVILFDFIIAINVENLF